MTARLWESPLRSVRVAALLAAALSIAVHLNVLDNEFAYDDHHILVENEAIHSLETLPDAMVAPYWPSRYGRELGLWRPGTAALFGLQWAALGDNPVGFHVVSLLLHAGVTALVVVLLARLVPLSGAFLGGLLFAVHPVHVEAVANIVGQAEIVITGLLLLACLIYLRVRPLEPLGWRRSAGICLLYALAFSVKEMAVTLPALLFLLDGAREDFRLADTRAYLKSRGPLFGALAGTAGALLWVRWEILGSVARPFAPMGADILHEIPRIFTVTATWPHYVRLLFFPADLSVDYSPAVIPVLFDWSAESVIGILVVLAFLGLAWAVWRSAPTLDGTRDSNRALGVAVIWFVITISPVSNVLFLSGVLLSERSFYLPSVGFVLGAGWALRRLALDRKRIALGVTVLALVLMGWRTWTRNPTWKDNLTIFDTLLREHPEAGRSQWVLGDVYYQKGRVSESLRAYRAAIGIIGSEYPLLARIAGRLAGAGRYDQAEVLLRFAWDQAPQFNHAPGLLAIVLADQGRFREAEEAARAALAAEPGDPVVHHLLAGALAHQGRYREALASRQAAIRLGEGDHWQQWRWLADLHVELGDTVRALQALDSARVRAAERGAISQIDSIRGVLAPGNESL